MTNKSDYGHRVPPAVESSVIVQLWTPAGAILEIPLDYWPSDAVRRMARANSSTEDVKAAVCAARQTGLTTTILRTSKTTVTVDDLVKNDALQMEDKRQGKL